MKTTIYFSVALVLLGGWPGLYMAEATTTVGAPALALFGRVATMLPILKSF